MDSKPNQDNEINRITATINETGEQLEITDPRFIQKLIDLGFHEGRNNKPEDLARILKNVPLAISASLSERFQRLTTTVNRRRKKATAKCPHCGRRLAGKPKPSPDPKRERLKEKLYLLSSGVPSQPGTKKEPRNSAGLAHPDDECD